MDRYCSSSMLRASDVHSGLGHILDECHCQKHQAGVLSAILAGQMPLPELSTPLLQSAGSQVALCTTEQPFGRSAFLCSGAATCCHVVSGDPQQAEAAAAHLLHGLSKHPSQHLGVSGQHMPAGKGSPPQPKVCPLTGPWGVRLCTAVQCNRASLLIPGDIQKP